MWKLRNSNVHGKGIFATEDIKNKTKIIEYIGEKVTKKEGDKRSNLLLKKNLHKKNRGSVYVFELNKKYDIDGSPLYNKARYINHSCDPNCEVDIIRGHIWISSIKKIKKGDELSYDYGYEFDKEDYSDHVCRCNSKKCIGYIISRDDWHKYRSYRKK
jgi:SET domain-containing protein